MHWHRGGQCGVATNRWVVSVVIAAGLSLVFQWARFIFWHLDTGGAQNLQLFNGDSPLYPISERLCPDSENSPATEVFPADECAAYYDISSMHVVFHVEPSESDDP